MLKKYKILLGRHGESIWNHDSKFTGWTNIPLSKNGINEAKIMGEVIIKNNLYPNIFFTSVLDRAINTTNIIKKTLIEYHNKSIDQEDIVPLYYNNNCDSSKCTIGFIIINTNFCPFLAQILASNIHLNGNQSIKLFQPDLYQQYSNNNSNNEEIEIDVSTIIFEDKQYLMDNENNIYDYITNEKIGHYKDYVITFNVIS